MHGTPTAVFQEYSSYKRALPQYFYVSQITAVSVGRWAGSRPAIPDISGSKQILIFKGEQVPGSVEIFTGSFNKEMACIQDPGHSFFAGAAHNQPVIYLKYCRI